MIAEEKAKHVIEACRKKHFRLATVESCTGGMIIASLTDISGSSDVVECGFITYSNNAKTALVNVDESLISSYGAVSEPVAIAMAEGALKYSQADIAVSATGIAGPHGGTPEKPVGLVYIAVALKGHKTICLEAHFKDEGREAIRLATVHQALDLLLTMLR